MSEYLIGVDLGQAQDYTALTVLQRDKTDTGNTYQVRHLERLPLGTPYPAQVHRVAELFVSVKALGAGTPRLIVDQTGVGRPVVDMLREAGMTDLLAVTITAGDNVSKDGREYRVPKRELVSVLQVLLQSERMVIAADLPESSVLTKELLAFRVKFTAKGHDSYGNDWRENDHDDMVLAVALAAWAGERASMAYQFAIV